MCGTGHSKNIHDETEYRGLGGIFESFQRKFRFSQKNSEDTKPKTGKVYNTKGLLQMGQIGKALMGNIDIVQENNNLKQGSNYSPQIFKAVMHLNPSQSVSRTSKNITLFIFLKYNRKKVF